MAVDPKYAAVETNSGLYVVRCAVTFALSAIASQVGRGVTFTRNTNGVYTAQFNERPYGLLGVHLSMMSASAFLPQVTADTLSTASTLQIKTFNTSAVATDPTNGDRMFCSFIMRTLP